MKPNIPAAHMPAQENEALIALVRKVESDGWLDRIENQHDALRALVETLLVSDPATAAEMVAILWRPWALRGHAAQCRLLLERAAQIDSAAREGVLEGLGTIAFRSGDQDAAERAFHERLSLVEQSGQKQKLAEAYTDLARIALRRKDFDAARAWAQRGYDAGRELGPEALLDPIHLLAAAARMQGRHDEARALYLESRKFSEQAGRLRRVAAEDHNLMYVALHAGDREEAERRFHASRIWILQHDDAYLRPYAILDAGVMALSTGDLERACKLVAAAQTIFDDTGSVPDPDDSVELDDAVARLRSELGARFEALWAAGEKLTLSEAQALAQ